MTFADFTYNDNLEGYHLVTFIVANGDNNGQPVGYAYIPNESKPVLNRVLVAYETNYFPCYPSHGLML